MTYLYWLPKLADGNDRLRDLSSREHPDASEIFNIMRSNLDYIQTGRVDKLLGKMEASAKPFTNSARLAILSSSTTNNLLPSIRVAGARRSVGIDIHVHDHGLYMRELLDKGSSTYAFKPTFVLFAFDQRHVLGTPRPAMSVEDAEETIKAVLDRMRRGWRLVRDNSDAAVIQQTILPVFPCLVGGNEEHLPGSPRRLTAQINARLAMLAKQEGVDLLDVATRAGQEGLRTWHDPICWFQAKQDVSLACAPVYGDLVARVIAARLGRSAKCIVLDLDNTLWGGVIGDDGLGGIVLGEGSALGEAYSHFQKYVGALARRGIVLAVCSKNDESNAWEPFDRHNEMAIKRADVACLVANWDDKASNVRKIADRLSLGLDSLVFVDDNQSERDLLRRELPMVATPELPEDPACGRNAWRTRDISRRFPSLPRIFIEQICMEQTRSASARWNRRPTWRVSCEAWR